MEKEPIKAMSKTELAKLYGVDPRTLSRWLIPFNDSIGKFTGIFTPRQVKIIYHKLGKPSEEL